MDLGASSHVTSDINNLSSCQPYNGSEVVHIDNGTGLLIAYKVSIILHTEFKSLVSNNILHVSAITKNLLSVSRLILDNNIYVEFTNFSYFIKDQETHKTLLHDILHKGLYKIVPSSSFQQQALHVTQASADI
jgi:hypothetical protein